MNLEHNVRPLPPRPMQALLLLVLLLAPLLSSCGVINWTRGVFGATMDVQLVVLESANQNYPVAVDVVLIYSDEMTEKLAGLTAREWFEQKQQFVRDYPDGFELYERELVPEYGEYTVPVRLRGSAVSSFMFVNYRSDGQHRERLTLYRDIKVTLGADDFIVSR